MYAGEGEPPATGNNTQTRQNKTISNEIRKLLVSKVENEGVSIQSAAIS
jgi:hypothetical protein